MYPKNAELGETVHFERPHKTRHALVRRWEPKVGGALCRCAKCKEVVEIAFLVLDRLMPESQLEWIMAAGEEAGLERSELFSN